MTKRKIPALLLAAVMLLALGACGEFVSIMPGTEYTSIEEPESTDQDGAPAFRETPLFSFLALETFEQNYYSDTPVALSYRSIVDSKPGCRAYVFDRASIISACDALRAMTVTGRTEETPVSESEFTLFMTGSLEHDITFGTLADGTRVLESNSGCYTVAGGDELFSIAFPAYSGDFDLFDLYFSDDVRAFADNFYTNKPVSVGCRMSSGATITSEDSALIDAVFEVLDGASVTVVENYPDQNIDLNQTRDYIFTMADGTYYTFSFAQQCLAVKAVPSFDTVYYWMSDISGLWDIQIMSDNNFGKFEGGPVSELRDDLLRASQAADGLIEDLGIAGVFVEYEIGEDSGYLTLSDDTAVAFLRQMFGIAVSDETVADPDGSRITVSVTLTDLSGPILYFIGDSIQQVVGVNYACSEDDMASLRANILELAEEGFNTAQVESGTAD